MKAEKKKAEDYHSMHIYDSCSSQGWSFFFF